MMICHSELNHLLQYNNIISQICSTFRFGIRDVPDLLFPIRPEPDLAGYVMTNLVGAGAGFSNPL